MNTTTTPGKIPFWSRGFARLCCDIYPNEFGRHKGRFFESGEVSDPKYFFQKPIVSGDIVYVVTSDFPRFLDVFVKLNKMVRITLVTGSEDIGVPWEIFHPNRTNFGDYNMLSLWPSGQVMGMKEFLNDKRLLKWYTQNYDMVGCNTYTCSDIDITKDVSIIKKVLPIPIGLDLHTLAEKNENTHGRIVKEQQNYLNTLVTNSLPFLKRELLVYAQFDCIFKDTKTGHMRQISRGEICQLLNNKNNSQIVPYKKKTKGSMQETKSIFWNQILKVQFAMAPPGFGIDTHRVWEILNLHCVPIVITSPLDILYEKFPVIIVKKWSEIFESKSLEKFRSQITTKFGEIPFNTDVKKMLTADFWKEKIRNESRLMLIN
mmetsp:Transcript_28826/g.27620  ORF Transcript_28826/g.27620 Transcript_28826/m.27620 type:complete len:374 (-) Transcript_28826:569-1690(-)